ncbi:MAG: hypothetical protein KAS66_10850 [Candidatus Omnitrophica bacterium]|nr:hypothetical protein [Candidatus Omnitrophota bacterium]
MIQRRSTRAKEPRIARAKKRRKRASASVPRHVREYNYYRYALYAIIASVFVFFITFRAINISVDRQLKIQIPEKRKPLSARLPVKPVIVEQIKEKVLPEIIFSDPEEYNIKTQERGALLQNQRRWNSSMRKTVREADIIDRMSEGDAFKGIKKTPEQFRQQLERIEGRIREYEKRVQNDPGDDAARKKLQGLYMLKATVKGLKKAVVEK